jgi:hypothetical protein
MSKNTDVFFEKTPIHKGVTFVNADGATNISGANTKEIISDPGADDGVIRMISASTDDSASNDIIFFAYDGVTKYPIGLVNLPLGSGTSTGTKAINCLNSIEMPHFRTDKDGNKYMVLKSGYSIYAGMRAAVTAAKTVSIFTTLMKLS